MVMKIVCTFKYDRMIHKNIHVDIDLVILVCYAVLEAALFFLNFSICMSFLASSLDKCKTINKICMLGFCRVFQVEVSVGNELAVCNSIKHIKAVPKVVKLMEVPQ